MRVYEVSSVIASGTGNKTLLLIQAPADAALAILEAHAYAHENDTNEQMDVDIRRVTTLGSPTGTSLTPHPHSLGDAAAGGTFTGDLTAEPTTYSSVRLGRAPASSLGGWVFQAGSLQEAVFVSPSASVGVFLATITTAKALYVSVRFAEIGG